MPQSRHSTSDTGANAMHNTQPKTETTGSSLTPSLSRASRSTSKDMPPPPLPPQGGSRSSAIAKSTTNTSASRDVPSHSPSRSPSRTPHMRASPLSNEISAPRVLEHTHSYPSPGPTVGLGRPRGHSTSSVKSVPILQSSAHPKAQSSHVKFNPSPPLQSLSSSMSAAQPQVAAAPMARVVSSPLPFPSDTSTPSTRPSTATKADSRRPGQARGRAFSLSSVTKPASGSRPSSPGKWDWFAQLSSSIIKRSRPRSASSASTHSIQSVNVAEVLSHRVTSADQVSRRSSTHQSGIMHESLAAQSSDGVFAWTVSEHDVPRTIDSRNELMDTELPGFPRAFASEHAEYYDAHDPPSQATIAQAVGSSVSDHRHFLGGRDPMEHAQEEEASQRVKEKVLRAAGYAADGAHELLAVSAEVLEFAPIPGLAQAARILLDIWAAVQEVDLNKKVCLRLTERCATMLISIREEIADADGLRSQSLSQTVIGSPRLGHLSSSPPLHHASLPGSSSIVQHPGSSGSLPVELSGSPKGRHGSPQRPGSESPRGGQKSSSPLAIEGTSGGSVANELSVPLERLISAFEQVLSFLHKQNRRPFLKRYLKRDEIQQHLAACDASLNDALGMFGLSIQIRILKQVLRAEEQRQAETAALFDRIVHTPPSALTALPPYHDSLPPPITTPGFHPGLVNPQAGPPALLEDTGSLLAPPFNIPAPTRLDSLGLPTLPTLDDIPLGSTVNITFPEPVHYPAYPIPMAVSRDPSKLDSNQVMSTLTQLAQLQNSHDLAHDTAALRQLLRKAVATNDDLEMLKVLQVRKEEMPEAIKALQRALETETTKEQEEEDRERVAANAEGVFGNTIWTSPVDDSGLDRMPAITDGLASGTVASETATQTVANVDAGGMQPAVDARTRESTSTSSGSKSSSHASRDTLDREFIESSIESLLRLSTSEGVPPASLSLPPWTITQYEVIREAKVGVGYFSEVWRGSYRGRTVAIKVLAPWTPKESFIKEVVVWNELRHPNVLELIGASASDAGRHLSPNADPGHPALEASVLSTATAPSESGSGWGVSDEDESPWFFVSRFYERGSLVKWVKGTDRGTWDSLLSDVRQGVLRMVHEVVRGMMYLHSRSILHGDLKCANILVNDFGHCIISDFGQSEMKSEACRISGVPLPHGTLRWQAPEIMAGGSVLTTQTDIYAFAITCYELLMKGGVPWPHANDDTVRHFVLSENKRPEPPSLRDWSPAFTDMMRRCWDRSPSSRPDFAVLDEELTRLRKQYGWKGIEVVHEGEADSERQWEQWIDGLDGRVISPSLTVVPLPSLPPDVSSVELPSFESYVTARASTPRPATADASYTESHHEDLYTHEPASEPSLTRLPEPDTTADATSYSSPEVEGHHAIDMSSSRASSLAFGTSSEHSERYQDGHRVMSPASAAGRRDERRYRMSLQHEYHASLRLPLWTPTPVAIGDIGYHSKSTGTFITLFNAFAPSQSSNDSTRKMSSIDGYVQGSRAVQTKHEKLDKRTATQKGKDLIHTWLSRGRSDDGVGRTLGRRYFAPLRNGHKAAHLFTESAMFHYMDDLAAPKRWFQAHVNKILKIYGSDHPIQREDILLVFGTLDAADYALFVSHEHPDCQVNFNVFTTSRPGQPWGQFSITDPSAASHGGPTYPEDINKIRSVGNGKISVAKRSSDSWDTVLVARLRFAPDMEEPTSR